MDSREGVPSGLVLHTHANVFGNGDVELTHLGTFAGSACMALNARPLEGATFVFCHAGACRADLSDGADLRLEAQETLVLFPGRRLTLRLKDKGSSASFLLLRGAASVARVIELGYWDLLKVPVAPEVAALRLVAEQFESSADRGRDPRVLALAEYMLDSLWQRARGASGHALFYDAVRRLHALPPDQLTTEFAAARLGISRSKLNQMFMAGLDERPGAYLARLKTGLLVDMLLNTDLTVGGISARMGFSSTSALACFFRRRKGCTPMEFRAGRCGA